MTSPRVPCDIIINFFNYKKRYIHQRLWDIGGSGGGGEYQGLFDCS